ncbi:MAG: hypothetical protein AAF988_08660 [Pseudomonadota bacterium]
MSKLDINAPWIDPDKLPKFARDFNNSRNLGMTKQTQQESQGQGSFVSHHKPASEIKPPPPPNPRKEREEEIMIKFWLKQQWQRAMAYAEKPKIPENDDHLKPEPNPKERYAMTQNTKNPNAPISNFREGSVNVSIWKQNKGAQSFYTAFVSKSYRAADGQWKEGKSFNEAEIKTLQSMLPEVSREMQNLREQNKSHEQEKTAPAHDMQAASEKAMQGAERAEAHTRTQEHSTQPSYESSPEPNQ